MHLSLFSLPILHFHHIRPYTSDKMSCAIGNMFIAVAGGLLDRSSRRKSIYVARPVATAPKNISKSMGYALQRTSRQ